MDAANCQTQNARLIIDQGGDYVLALTGNQATLHYEVKALFETEGASGFKKVQHTTLQQVSKRNGRAETRRYTLVHDSDYAENFVVVRHIALNLLKQDTSVKLGIKSKRKLAGWSHPSLLKLLAGLF